MGRDSIQKSNKDKPTMPKEQYGFFSKLILWDLNTKIKVKSTPFSNGFRDLQKWRVSVLMMKWEMGSHMALKIPMKTSQTTSCLMKSGKETNLKISIKLKRSITGLS